MTSRQKPRLQAGFGTETPTEDADERVSNAGGEEETSEEPRRALAGRRKPRRTRPLGSRLRFRLWNRARRQG